MSPSSGERPAVTRESVLRAALDLADAQGVAKVTMRSLAEALDVRPMSLYHHVAGKEAILDGIVDLVFAEIALPRVGEDWRAEMRRRAESARAALVRHPWALGLMETRTSPGPHTLRHHDATLGTLRAGGLSLEQAALAYAALDAYVYGFALQQASLPFDTGTGAGAGDRAAVEEVAADLFAGFREAYPHLEEFATQHVLRPGYDFGAQFAPGLEILLAGLPAPPRP